MKFICHTRRQITKVSKLFLFYFYCEQIDKVVEAESKTERQRRILRSSWKLVKVIGDQNEPCKLVWAGSIALNPNLDIVAIADSYNSQVHLCNSDLVCKCSMGIKQVLPPGTTVYPREVAF